MITGFTEETAKLTERELQAIPHIVKYLNSSSKEKPIKNRKIASDLILVVKWYFEPPRIRKMINYISLRNMTDLPLVANSKGYYVTNDKDEVKRYCQSLKDRLGSISARYRSVLRWQISP